MIYVRVLVYGLALEVGEEDWRSPIGYPLSGYIDRSLHPIVGSSCLMIQSPASQLHGLILAEVLSVPNIHPHSKAR
jgi:hypothetical protein